MSSPFNEEKYKRLLEGLEISEIKFSELNTEHRIDSEYFSKQNLIFQKKLLDFGIMRIGDIATVTDGIHTSIDYDDSSYINLISATSPKENFFDLSRGAFISEKSHKDNPRTALCENDVIVSTVGTIGNCAVVDKTILPANSDRHVGIIRLQKEYSPYVLSTFLLSKYGRMQTIRESTGNVQLNLFIYKIKELLVPKFSKSFQHKIEQIVKLAHTKQEESKNLYKEAENRLLIELGAKNWQPINKNISIKNLSKSFLSSGRLDAEYYQSKYDEIESMLLKNKQVKIKDLIKYPISSGSTPKAGDGKYYTDKKSGIPFLRAVDIVQSKVDTENLLYIKPEVHKKLLKRTQLHKGDVLFSIAGTVGRCGIFDYDFEANINQAIAIIRFDESVIKHLYLVQFFNSKIGQIIIEKYARQGLQTNLNLEELSNLQIPILTNDIQEKIADCMQQSFALKADSKRLLEEAKIMVEREIEA